MSVETWKSIADWATIVFIALTVVSGSAALILGDRINEKQANLSRQFALELAEANERAALANLQLEELRAKVGPRRIDKDIFLARISGAAKKVVVVSHAPDNPHSYMLAMDILDRLAEAKWDAKYIGNTAEEVKLCGAQFGGVLVLSRTASQEETDDFRKPPKQRASSWGALTDALNESLGDNQVGFATCPFIPADVLQVVISAPWVFFPKENH
jgi:hypothetical protein